MEPHEDSPQKISRRGRPGTKHPTPGNDYDKVNVLVLTFDYDDLDLENETKEIVKVFQSLNYKVDKFPIPMDNSLNKLRERLDTFLAPKNPKTLLIIYYHGHGGIEADGTLSLASHNVPDDVNELWRTILHVWGNDINLPEAGKYLRNVDDDRLKKFQPVAEIHWKEISNQIMQAEFDTLMILDCCNAGLAAASSQVGAALKDPEQSPEAVTNYRKELIGASSWGTDTKDRMSPALWNSLYNAVGEKFGSISTPSLVRRMNNWLVTEIGGMHSPAQAVHYVLKRNNADKMILHLPRAQKATT